MNTWKTTLDQARKRLVFEQRVSPGSLLPPAIFLFLSVAPFLIALPFAIASRIICNCAFAVFFVLTAWTCLEISRVTIDEASFTIQVENHS